MGLRIRFERALGVLGLLFLGYVEVADPGRSSGGEVLAGVDFEGALIFEMTDDAFPGNGVHFEIARALEEWNALGD